MNFEQQELTKQVAEAAREFAKTQIAPHLMEWDEQQFFPKQALQELGKLGMMGVLVPEQYGGAGLSYAEYKVVVEEISKVCGAFGLSVAAHNSLCTGHLLAFGNEEQKEKECLVLKNSEEKTIKFLSDEFEITEMNSFLNYSKIVSCVKLISNKGEEEFKRFKDQIWNYFQYKKAEKEKKHGFQSFIGTAEAQFLDGGWNADNWIKKNKDLHSDSETNGVLPKEESKNKIDYSWNKKRNTREKDLTQICSLNKNQQ